jgi:hypothetical protein
MPVEPRRVIDDVSHVAGRQRGGEPIELTIGKIRHQEAEPPPTRMASTLDIIGEGAAPAPVSGRTG